MTENKPIMIDGVDVSGCKHYKNRNCIADYCLTDMPFSETKCELNTNCYYKQLKAKTQECEELRTDIKDIANLLDLDTVEEYSFSNIELEIKELKQQLDQLKASKEQAEQKIEKIRQVCAETKDVGENIKDMYTAKLSRLYLKSRQILQIINEVNDDIKIS